MTSVKDEERMRRRRVRWRSVTLNSTEKGRSSGTSTWSTSRGCCKAIPRRVSRGNCILPGEFLKTIT